MRHPLLLLAFTTIAVDAQTTQPMNSSHKQPMANEYRSHGADKNALYVMNHARPSGYTLLPSIALPPAARENNPGYFHGGLNLRTGAFGYTSPGFIIGLGSAYYFGDYVAEKLRFGLNMGWFSLASNFGNKRTTLELQFVKPGFLFSADLTDKLRLDFKYSAMPTVCATLYTNSKDELDGFGFYGLAHGPYFGIKTGKFMAGSELVFGRLHYIDDDPSVFDLYRRVSANTFRLMVGVNW